MLANRWITTLITAGVVLVLGGYVRWINLFHTGYEFDIVTTQYTWANSFASSGVWNGWLTYNQYLDYPPLNLVFITGVEMISRWMGLSGSLGFALILKSIYWAADVLLIIIISKWLVMQKVDPIKVWWVSIVLYSYPGLWFVSAVWGQSDTLHALLVAVSILFLFSKKSIMLLVGGALLAVALWFKLQILLVILSIAIVLLLKHGKLLFDQYKYIVALSVPLAITSAFSTRWLGSIWGDNTGLYTGDLNFVDIIQPAHYLASLPLVFLTALWLIASAHFAVFSPSIVIRQLSTWLSGFFGISTLVIAVFSILNPLQWYRTIYEPLYNSVGYFSASLNLNNGVVYALHLIGRDYRTVYGTLATVLFASVLAWWVYRNKESMRWNVATLYITISLVFLSYFAFSAGRVHSRYGHFAIVFLIIMSVFVKKKVSYFAALVVVLGLYAYNQVKVMVSSGNNSWLQSNGWDVIKQLDSFYLVFVGVFCVSALIAIKTIELEKLD